MVSQKTAALLRTLADKYETADFLKDDPSQFMRRFRDPLDQELFAFVAAQVAFGKRELFIAKLNKLYADVMENAATEIAGKTKIAGGQKTPPFARWLLDGGHKKFFPMSDKKFYRFFSDADMNSLCGRLAEIVRQHGSLGEAVRAAYLGLAKSSGKAESANSLRLVTALISLFPGQKCVSQNPKGACKKLHMFLRWMVRRGSPVDLGLWDWASAADLLIPLDTHVLQESARLGLIAPKAAASAKTAVELTQKMAQVFPGDPTRADYALFGVGVSK